MDGGPLHCGPLSFPQFNQFFQTDLVCEGMYVLSTTSDPLHLNSHYSSEGLVVSTETEWGGHGNSNKFQSTLYKLLSAIPTAWEWSISLNVLTESAPRVRTWTWPEWCLSNPWIRQLIVSSSWRLTNTMPSWFRSRISGRDFVRLLQSIDGF